jgi:mRNA interferase RelE/StbE
MDLRRRVVAAIDNLADNPRPPGCRKLAGKDDMYRIRVGDWRISYAVFDDILIVLVVEIKPRGDAYRKL